MSGKLTIDEEERIGRSMRRSSILRGKGVDDDVTGRREGGGGAEKGGRGGVEDKKRDDTVHVRGFNMPWKLRSDKPI